MQLDNSLRAGCSEQNLRQGIRDSVEGKGAGQPGQRFSLSLSPVRSYLSLGTRPLSIRNCFYG